MLPNPPTILAINPGTRYLGLAVFDGNELLEWRIKVIKGRWSTKKSKKALAIFDAAIDRYRPRHLAVKELNPARSSSGLNSLATQIKKLALADSMTVHQYPLKVLEASFCEEKRNKRTLAEAIAANYPELYCELQIEKSRKNPYHMHMFEAVALGAMCANELDE